MRMRKKKNGEARLNACRELIFEMPESPTCDPAAVMNMSGAPVYLEIGAGKGGFAAEMTKRNPNAAYFAMERVSDCVVLAAEKAKSTAAERPDNLRFIVDTADNLSRIFKMGTVDKIFLNFSDPWTKKGYAKRRLTHRRYLSLYFNLLKEGGSLTFKTDNVALFDFSLEEVEAIGLVPDAVTRDLHASEWNEGNVMTEYETAFSAEGMKINMLSVRKPRGFDIEISPELLPDRKTYGKDGK
ncbi:MAG: tRNA (guanosine(46)-N7)-methyltransferase TrmB [Clostridia bacterium]|nr:tRNA (guanosine(46)-N7)-methyltransferase TrmB [Clostridia bacterium]